jgi:DNA-binding transcriptional LysR family regulator
MNLSAFDLNLLKVLDALLREGSTVRAGERIGLSQPAVSAALGRLRAVLDDPLFVREGQSLRPTEFALTLMQPLQQVLEQTARLMSRPVFDPATATDLFRVVASDFFTEMMLPDLMARLEQVAPGVTLRYSDAINARSLDDLREDRLDLVIAPKPVFPSWLECEPVLSAEFCIVARKNHPVLARHGVPSGAPIPMDLYVQLRHASFRAVVERPEVEDEVLAAMGRSLQTVLSAPNFTAVWRSVAATDLVGMVPRLMAERVAASAGLEIYPMPYALPNAELFQAWHRRNSHAAGLKWLRRQIADILANLQATGTPGFI